MSIYPKGRETSMIKNKTFYIFLTGSLLLALAACNPSKPDTDTIKQEEPKTDISNETDQADDNQSEPEKTVEQEIVLPTESLQKGDKGDGVLQVQNALIKLGYPIMDSSLFDRETVWAITDIQLQTEAPAITGIYDKDVHAILEKALAKELVITPEAGLPLQDDKKVDDDTVIIANPYEILALVNKQNALPEDYEPTDMVIPDVRFPFIEDVPKKQMRKIAADALEKMFADADLEGLDLFAQSGFRSYERQDSLFATYVSQHGEKEANNFSAKPGESEHQSGLTMDVTSPHVNYDLGVEFGETEEGMWLQEHAAEYGFIIRYPKGKEEITKYQYEPWHLRYVGIKAATEIMKRGITLEEYLEEILPE
jgi:zinc D-Ala-D-Ala carboxypeptidase